MSPQAAGAVSFLGDWATILIGLVLVITHVSPVDELGPVRVAVVLTSLAAVILAFGAQQRHRRWLRQHPGVNA